jgi:hypothetical protein
MKIKIIVKSLSSKKHYIDRHEMDIGPVTTSNILIEQIVRNNVKAYNEKNTDQAIFRYLSDEEIEDGASTGKIGFGDKKNDRIVDETAAVDTALLAFSDGLFRLYVNDKAIDFGEDVQLNEGDEIVFIRLTMLAGRLW